MSGYCAKSDMLNVIRILQSKMDGSGARALENVISAVEDMVEADVVRVVHCKDCKKYAREEWKRKLDEPHSFADTEWKMEFSGCMGFDDPEKGFCYAGEKVTP